MTIENKLNEIIEVLEKGCSHMSKDELNEKIKAKMKAEMDKRGFGEADATRHVIDRDRGEMPQPPKPKKTTLLQSEQDVQKDDMGVKPSEQKYHIHVDGYRVTKAPMSLGEIHATQGKDLEKDPNVKIVPHNPMAKEEVYKVDSNGQWKIEKSNYGPKE